MAKLESKLTRLQAALQQHLRANSGKTLSREQLCSVVWRMNFYRQSRTIDQTISVVRKHLAEEERIVTVFGVGYRHEEGRRVLTDQLDGRKSTVVRRRGSTATQSGHCASFVSAGREDVRLGRG